MEKYINIVFIFFTTTLLMSCEGDPINYQYIVENQSGVPIQLKLYTLSADGQVSLIRYINLDNGQTIEKRAKRYRPSSEYDFVEFFRQDEGSPNAMEVIYNNQKKTVFFLQRYTSVVKNTCEDDFGREVPCDPRNLLNTFIYSNINEHYIFTAEDYQQADDCKGNCE
ncbi:hypothetical protein [Flavobacterium sp. JP2137]|uniref:hypothetical protein n=1 Tax=Flavobacterium sp. JP2137 TaxID=3414510 RepID=UPI003D2FD2BB